MKHYWSQPTKYVQKYSPFLFGNLHLVLKCWTTSNQICNAVKFIWVPFSWFSCIYCVLLPLVFQHIFDDVVFYMSCVFSFQKVGNLKLLNTLICKEIKFNTCVVTWYELLWKNYVEGICIICKAFKVYCA